MNGYSADQIRSAEAPHLAAGEPLMQRAAAGLAALVADRTSGPVLVLAGSGDNGGDALFAAARLAEAGRRVAVVRTGSRVHERGLEAALASGATLQTADQLLGLSAAERPGRRGAVLDGMLGIGRTGSTALRSPAREIADAINALPADDRPLVVAVDIPSGIDADSGQAPDAHVVRADLTVTFGGVKAGLLRGDGQRLASEVVLVDVGIGEELATMEPVVTSTASS
jgi:hydroxyethylthiazole kinase-like uncharacterized protein yjeF